MTIAGSLLRSFLGSAKGSFNYAFRPYTTQNIGKNYLKSGRGTGYQLKYITLDPARNQRLVQVTPRRPGDFTSSCWAKGGTRRTK